MPTLHISPDATAPARTAPMVAFAPLALSLAMVVAGGLMATSLEVEDIVDTVGFLAFPVVGGLLLIRGVTPRIGRLFGGIGLLLGAGSLAGGYADQDLPGAAPASLATGVCFVGLITVLLTFVPLNFPDGRLPSRRWRPVAWASVVSMLAAATSMLLMPGPVDEDTKASPDNPWGIAGAKGILELVEVVSLIGFAVLALTCLASLLLRLRGATGDTRRKIAVLGVGVGTLLSLFLLDSTLQGIFGDVYGVIAAVVATSAIPVATAVALLRDPE